jgi:hypothetical protein
MIRPALTTYAALTFVNDGDKRATIELLLKIGETAHDHQASPI